MTQTLILYGRALGIVVASPLVFVVAMIATVLRQILDAASDVWAHREAPERTTPEAAKKVRKRKEADKRRDEAQKDMRKAEREKAATKADEADKATAAKLEKQRTRIIGVIEEGEANDES